MREMILNTNILPAPLFNLIHAAQVRVQETNEGIILTPVKSVDTLAAIKKARGMLRGGNLSVEKFLDEKHAEEAEL
jgi:hypothetical protein